ncbi:MAG: MBL fold metallo-hydrolase [Pseudomonadota bacterium]
MGDLALRFLGVGNAGASPALGCAAAVLERDGEPLLLIDCGWDTLSAFEAQYGGMPTALFLTHAHLDHTGGLENLFFRAYLDPALRDRVRLFLPVWLVTLIHQRFATYPGMLAEGGANFWDAFRLIPVSDGFCHQGLDFQVFPGCHHQFLSAFGLSLPGMFFYSGDTRPIPGQVARFAPRDEAIFHDVAAIGNPSHSGVVEILASYCPDQQRRLIAYHYESPEAARQITASGLRVARRGEVFSFTSAEVGAR